MWHTFWLHFVKHTYVYEIGTGVAQSVQRLSTGWTVRGSNPGVGARFSASVQTGPDAQPVSYKNGTGFFPGAKLLGVALTTHPQFSAKAKEKLEPYLYSQSGPSWPVLGWSYRSYFYRYVYGITYVMWQQENTSPVTNVTYDLWLETRSEICWWINR